MLVVSNLTVDYPDGTRAIDDVSFGVGPGENVALIGANGAGKTTLLLALVGILKAAAGDVSACGSSLKSGDLRELRMRIGLVFQNPDDQLFMPDIYEDLAFGPRSMGIDETEIASRIANTLSCLGINHLAHRSPLKLSGGEKRSAAIAAVLTMAPEYLLFDEPTAYLDPKAKRRLIETFCSLPQGKLIATHDLAFAKALCSRVLLLQGGKLIADDGAQLFGDAAILEASGL